MTSGELDAINLRRVSTTARLVASVVVVQVVGGKHEVKRAGIGVARRERCHTTFTKDDRRKAQGQKSNHFFETARPHPGGQVRLCGFLNGRLERPSSTIEPLR